jgi:polar amino acid transport system substrate-binding protein
MPGRFNQKFQLSQQVQGIAVRKGSTELLESVNAFLKKVKTDGQLTAIHEKWLGAPLPRFVAETN